MKKYPAMAVVEFRDISMGMYATDTMLKKSPIGFIRCGSISRGRYLTVIGGTTASVEEAYHEGLFWGGEGVLDHVMLADVHPQVHDAILGTSRADGSGSIAIVETPTVSSNVRAAELALKGTPITLRELRLADAGLSGKGLSVYQGELYDIEAAMDIVSSFLRTTGRDVTYKIISSPHDATNRRLALHSHFGTGSLMDLDGEFV